MVQANKLFFASCLLLLVTSMILFPFERTYCNRSVPTISCPMR